MKWKALCFLLLLAILSASCKVGPNYSRPGVPTPPTHRSASALPAAPATGAPPTLAEVKWFDLFKDEKLQQLIRAALENNYDVRIAAQRVLAAQAYVTVERAPLYPSLDMPVTADFSQGTRSLTMVSAGGRVTWEMDIWGRIRRSSEAAVAQYLSQQAVQEGVIQSLVTGVAGSYFQLLELDQELEIARRSLASRQDSARLVEARMTGGVANMVDVEQARSLVADAASRIADIEGRREQAENLINTLLGRNPGPVERKASLDDQKLAPEVPPGLPSALLERRPDIRLAEQQLVAANAQVGVAKSLFFPSIALTGSGGYRNLQLSASDFQMVGGVWGAGASLVMPLFNAKGLWANYRASKAQREAAILTYQKAVQTAFADVADSLIGYQKAREYRAQREIFVGTLRNQLRLANMRYRGGVSSYMEVLDTEREAMNAEMYRAQAYLAELDSAIRLYKALGGGWSQ